MSVPTNRFPKWPIELTLGSQGAWSPINLRAQRTRAANLQIYIYMHICINIHKFPHMNTPTQTGDHSQGNLII